MKKQLFLAGSLLALLAVSSCTKDEIIESTETPQSEIPEGYFKPVLKADFNSIANYPLDEAQSRHHVGMDGKANWVEGDTLLVAVLKETDLEDEFEIGFGSKPATLYTFLYSASGDFKQATNEAQLNLSKDTVYRWIAVNPGTYDKIIEYRRDEQGAIKEDNIRVGITSFTPAKQSVETPEKHLAKLDEMQGMCTVKGNPSMKMKHLGTLMKFEIVNNTTEPFNLQGIRMEASNSKVIMNGVDVFGSWSGSPSTEVTLNGTCALETGKSYTVATIVKDFGLKAQESLKIHVRTDKGVFIKEYPMSQDITFTSGTWNSATVEITADGMTQYNDNNLYIPDLIFRKFLTDACNKTADAALSKTDLEGITELNIGYDGKSISSLQGLEYLTNLSKFTLHNYQNPNIDFSKNEALTELDVNCSLLKELNIEKNETLTKLDVESNLLKELNISNNKQLAFLNVGFNQLKELNLENNKKLTKLYAYNNQLTKLNLVNNEQLTELIVGNNQLTELNITNNTALTGLNVSYNQLKKLNLTNNTALTELKVSNNQLKELNLTNNKQLTELNVSNNQLKELNITNNTALTELDAHNNQLKELNITNNTALTELDVENNQLKELNITNNTALTFLDASNNQFTELDISNCKKLDKNGWFDARENSNLQTIWVWEGFEFDKARPRWKPAVTTELYKVKTNSGTSSRFGMDNFGKGNEDFLK